MLTGHWPMVDGLSVMGLRYGAVEVHGIVSALKRTAFCTGRSNGRAQRAGLPLRGSCVCSTQALVHVSACLHDAQRPRSSRRRAGDGLKPLQPFQPPFVEIQGALTQIPRSRAPQSPAHTAVARPPSTDVYSGTQHNTLSDSEAEALSVSGSRSADSNELTLMKQVRTSFLLQPASAASATEQLPWMRPVSFGNDTTLLRPVPC